MHAGLTFRPDLSGLHMGLRICRPLCGRKNRRTAGLTPILPILYVTLRFV